MPRDLLPDHCDCAWCDGNRWVSSETGEPIHPSRLGYRSDAVECSFCADDDASDETQPKENDRG